jgi:hypothetical protein
MRNPFKTIPRHDYDFQGPDEMPILSIHFSHHSPDAIAIDGISEPFGYDKSNRSMVGFHEKAFHEFAVPNASFLENLIKFRSSSKYLRFWKPLIEYLRFIHR